MHFLRYVALMLAFAVTLPCLRGNAVSEESQHTYASVLMEAESGSVLRETNAQEQLPIGSLAKLMTVYLAAEAVSAGEWHMDTLLTAPPSAQTQNGAVIWLISGEKMSVQDLLKGVIIGNANDAAVTLACCLSGSEAQFAADMNAAAFSLGMRSTCFADATGLSPDNRSTAQDMALLCRALLQYDYLMPIFTTWRDFLRGEQTELVNENTLTRTYDGILGLKAGHGEPSGYTLCAAAEQGEMRCIAVVLGCDDESERFTYAKNLLRAGFSEYHVVTPDFDTEFLRPVTVRGGVTGAVSLSAEGLLCTAVPNGKSLSCVIVLPQYVKAPVEQGKILGEAAFYCGDALVYEVPLRAAETVAKKRLRDCFAVLLENLFK